MRRALTSALNRKSRPSSLFVPRWTASRAKADETKPLTSALTLAAVTSLSLISLTACEFRDDVIHVSNEYSEEERFHQCVAYHRCFIEDYRNRWQYKAQTTPTTTSWPLHVPTDEQVSSLEYDLNFCKSDDDYCRDLQFRLATYYLDQTHNPALLQKGFKMVKHLAQSGHGDAMCMYGIVLNEGKVVESNVQQATVWWRRAVDSCRHVQSTYELAVAFYTGEGVPESEELAVHYFERAATMGHAGAAYMLGDCLLEGVGAPRDRAEALEWLVAAGELGHRGARSRVLAVLEDNGDGVPYGRFTDKSRQTLVDNVQDVQEEAKWRTLEEEDGPKEVSIERRFTIGGGSGNPVVLAKRKTVVAESRTP